MFNVNMPYKHVRLNDSLSSPFTFNDERFSYLKRIVFWLDAWKSLPGKEGKLSSQTFTSFRHACVALPQICNHLTQNCGFSYLLTSFLQTDPLEHHFGLYRMMSGANYHVSYLQILETERRLKVSNILKIFTTHPESNITLQDFIMSFSSSHLVESQTEVDLDPFLNEISDLSIIECDTQLLQSLTFIAGYATHQYLKHSSQLCHICQDMLTIEKDLLIDDTTSRPEFKLIELSDRGGLKYPSEIVLDAIIVVWKLFILIENNSELMSLFLGGPSRKILVDLTLNYLEDSNECDSWKYTCPSCNVCGLSIVRRLIFVASNCLIANKVKNYNSIVVSKGIEKRKLKKFS